MQAVTVVTGNSGTLNGSSHYGNANANERSWSLDENKEAEEEEEDSEHHRHHQYEHLPEMNVEVQVPSVKVYDGSGSMYFVACMT